MKARGKSIDMNRLSDYSLFTTGISLVFHAQNPNIPTVHLNYRILCIKDQGTVIDCWFGGVANLTPYYLVEEDCVLFHQEHKKACDFLDPDFYQKAKKDCDDYFLIVHRGIRRGIGGIWFDD